MKVTLPLFTAALILTAGTVDSKAAENSEMVNVPTRQSELAIDTLKILQEHGEDLSVPRHTLHYFYNGDFDGLAKALEARGFKVRPTVGHDGVVAERMDVTDEHWRVETLTELSVLANQFGCEYDGWEAATTRQAH